MNPEPPPPRPHYAWPKYVLAALGLFLFVCVTWTCKEVHKVKRYQRVNSSERILSAATNGAPASNRPAAPR